MAAVDVGPYPAGNSRIGNSSWDFFRARQETGFVFEVALNLVFFALHNSVAVRQVVSTTRTVAFVSGMVLGRWQPQSFSGFDQISRAHHIF